MNPVCEVTSVPVLTPWRRAFNNRQSRWSWTYQPYTNMSVCQLISNRKLHFQPQFSRCCCWKCWLMLKKFFFSRVHVRADSNSRIWKLWGTFVLAFKNKPRWAVHNDVHLEFKWFYLLEFPDRISPRRCFSWFFSAAFSCSFVSVASLFLPSVL